MEVHKNIKCFVPEKFGNGSPSFIPESDGTYFICEQCGSIFGTLYGKSYG